ncbi:thiosulfate/3-mercaptopyruvate sulfurtransferase [Sphingomonas kaistensis]|uniref:3-mercaptopyruvate sulfurtransferase n=1 Tax=Sphingomonas kaistensis TaxID=298708 RepID=A0A7X6BFT1_9SPHN|nr:sulfurtransferase [Sphingomonas kaistensis]NJC04356.1 thiosulfate/3-mercaptopyruvate sulfurtransferase [Sphingomonas kaistensis]
MDALVSVSWLAASKGAADVVVLDASWHLPDARRDARADFARRHIPGARFFDIAALADTSATSPHMLPPAGEFAAAMEALGVGSDDRIVIYDDSAIHTSARAWFTLRHFGAERVAILDGGLNCWIAEGQPVSAEPPTARPARFEARVPRPEAVVSKGDLLRGTGMTIADARSPERFAGTGPEPRPGLEPGHIPGSRNLPMSALYDADGRFRPPHELRQLFVQHGIDPERPFVASCGSGVTANSLIFAAHLLGNRDSRLYDGSWSEWGADPLTPKERG